MFWHCFLSCGRSLDWFFSLPFVNCREVLYCRYSSTSSACHALPVSLRTCLMGYCQWWRVSAYIVVIPSRLATPPPSSSSVPVVLSLWLTFIGGKSKMRTVGCGYSWASCCCCYWYSPHWEPILASTCRNISCRMSAWGVS